MSLKLSRKSHMWSRRTFCSELRSKYANRVHSTFEQYAEQWTYESSSIATKYINNHITKNYIDTNAIKRDNYIEIGIGGGYAVEHYSPYFNNMILVEPNSVF
eukprot:129873_1